jgi:hypothetical protein
MSLLLFAFSYLIAPTFTSYCYCCRNLMEGLAINRGATKHEINYQFVLMRIV